MIALCMGGSCEYHVPIVGEQGKLINNSLLMSGNREAFEMGIGCGI